MNLLEVLSPKLHLFWFLRSFQVNKEDVLGKKFFRLFLPDDTGDRIWSEIRSGTVGTNRREDAITIVSTLPGKDQVIEWKFSILNTTKTEKQETKSGETKRHGRIRKKRKHLVDKQGRNHQVQDIEMQSMRSNNMV
jgi:hypothetical protein